MKSQKLARTAVRGILWAFASRFTGKAMVLVTILILARLLSRDDFGVAAYALLVIGLLDVSRGLGVGPALVYHRADPRAADTAFALSLLSGLLLYGLTWWIAPYVGTFFNDPRAVSVTIVLGLAFPVSAFGTVHEALLQKELSFKRKFVPDALHEFTKGVVCVVLALLNYGAWSLILGQIAGRVVRVIALWLVHPWRPTLRIDFALARSLVRYGSHIIALGGIGYALMNAGPFFVGRYLGAIALGVYTVGLRLPRLFLHEVTVVISSVLFPTYATLRNAGAELTESIFTGMRYLAAVTVPIGLGLCLLAKPLIIVLLSEKWLDALPVVQAMALAMMMSSLAFTIGDVYKAIGRPDVLLKLALVRGSLLLPLLWWAVTGPATLSAVARVYVLISIIGMSLSVFIASRILEVPLRRFAVALAPAAGSGLTMAMCVLGVLYLLPDGMPILKLIAAILTGIIVYTLVLPVLCPDIVKHAVPLFLNHLREAEHSAKGSEERA